jgi:hypothetical protein
MKHFYLFGKNACAAIAEENVNGLLEAYENDAVDSIELFVFEDGVTTPTDLLAAFCGHEDYYCLSEEEYNALKSETPIESLFDGSQSYESILGEVVDCIEKFNCEIETIDANDSFIIMKFNEEDILLNVELYDSKSLRHNCIDKFDFDKINNLWLNNANITTDTMEIFIEFYAQLIDELGFKFESCSEDAKAVCLSKKGVYLYFNSPY